MTKAGGMGGGGRGGDGPDGADGADECMSRKPSMYEVTLEESVSWMSGLLPD